MKSRRYAGQSLVEFLLVAAVVGLVCIPAISFARSAFAALYVRHQEGLNNGQPVGALEETATPDTDVPPTATLEPTPTVAPTATAVPTATATPTEVPYSTPTKTSQCKHGGWKTFNPPDGPFTSQQDCINYVNGN